VCTTVSDPFSAIAYMSCPLTDTIHVNVVKNVNIDVLLVIEDYLGFNFCPFV
jgi:hypothetical protein